MGLADDMDALGRALERGQHHATYLVYGEHAKTMLTAEQYKEAKAAAKKDRRTPRPAPLDLSAQPERDTYRLLSKRGD